MMLQKSKTHVGSRSFSMTQTDETGKFAECAAQTGEGCEKCRGNSLPKPS
jgi:hypothetical protein